MERIKQKIDKIYAAPSKSPKLSSDLLDSYGLQDITLRPYQLDGIQWLAERYHREHGCILADEMGLGKTCQTISFLVYLQGSGESLGPHLILCPLSVVGNWITELKRFAPGLKVVSYKGNKEERPVLQKQMRSDGNFNVVVTTYEICMKDESFLRKYSWHTLVVDEAHRLKNRESLLHKILREFDVNHTVLLTGTPVQNNLRELYALLSFVASPIFRDKYMEDFVDEFEDCEPDQSNSDMSELHKLLKPFLLRRIKSEVVKDLPKKTEVLLYHGMSALQKKYYKAILTKDIEAFENPNKKTKTSMMNILMQLRKCVDHPYLFDGVEPEPFVLGEHLVEASGKLVLLDQLLTYLKVKGHKVLLFSQMTRMLDIVQDYLGYRGLSYERLDGSVRGEERYLAIQNFNEMDDTFIFLLSTKAGGVGLNLVAADTVIFLDSDFNPQNDLQAAARAHRIGQTRSVKVIRLIGRSTVEEIVMNRATAKLKLTQSVIEGGQFSTAADKMALVADDNMEMSDILKFGVDRLFKDDESTLEDVDLDAMLGQTVDGQWKESLPGSLPTQSQVELESMEEEDAEPGTSGGMYMFEGTDYSKNPTSADKKAFDELVSAEKAEVEQAMDEGRASRRNNASLTNLFPELPGTRKPRKQLTPEEKEAMKLKRAETMARKAKEFEEELQRKQEARLKRIEKMRRANGYESLNITLDSEGEESGEEGAEPNDIDQSEDEDSPGVRRVDLGYLVGDVTQPQNVGEGNAIIVHCVDDSGRWGRGGLFTALTNRSKQPAERYELAGKMEDIELGDVILIPLDDTDQRQHGMDYCSLVVAQERDRHNNLSGIKMSALSGALKKIHKAAKSMKASVHFPRIGHNTPGFNWYGTERLIRKHLAARGITTYIYYYPRRQKKKRQPSESDNDSSGETTLGKPKVRRTESTSKRRNKSRSQSPQPGPSSTASSNYRNNISTDKHTPKNPQPSTAKPSAAPIADFMSGVSVHIVEMPQDLVDKYHRHLAAHDGDLDEFMSATTTHIVVPHDLAEDQQEELIQLIQQYPKVPVVTDKWLRACFKHRTRVDTKDFLYG